MSKHKDCGEFWIPDWLKEAGRAHRLHESAYGRPPGQVTRDRAEMGGTIEMLKLRHRSADHAGPDALVYIPPGFDAGKPIQLVVYNHGLGTDVSEAFRKSQLKAQIDESGANTVLIMPEWQANPRTRDGFAGRFLEQGFFSTMLQEIMQRTPQLARKTLDDVQSVSVFTHSGGYNAAASEIYRNGLGNKVTSVTLLDSLYSGGQFDRWIEEHIRDLAQGRMHFNNIFGQSTQANSKDAARRVEGMLRRAGLPLCSLREDFDGRTIMPAQEIARHGLVFKRSDVRVSGRDAHNSVTNIYPGQVLQAENYYAYRNRLASPRLARHHFFES